MYGDRNYEYGNPEDYDDSSSSQYSESSVSSGDEDNLLGLIHPAYEGKDTTHHSPIIDPEYVTKAGKKYAVLDWKEELRQSRKKQSQDEFEEEAPKM